MPGVSSPPCSDFFERPLNRRRAGQLLVGAAGAALLPSNSRAAHQIRPWTAGKPAPRLELTDLTGKTWSLAALRGQVVLLNFWATWCEPCRAEMPSLELLAQKFEQDGLLVLAVNYQEALPAIRRFLEAQPVTLPILLDRTGEAAAAWTPRVFPSTVLIDRSGQPQRTVLGELDWTGPVARELVAPLVAAPRKA
jgi:thiol-disulfide isomerase/thioredoxin